MHQTRKNQQLYFAMKMHIGVDGCTGLAPRAVETAANMHDKHPLPELPHRNELCVETAFTPARRRWSCPTHLRPKTPTNACVST